MGSNLFVRVGKDCTRRAGVRWVRLGLFRGNSFIKSCQSVC